MFMELLDGRESLPWVTGQRKTGSAAESWMGTSELWGVGLLCLQSVLFALWTTQTHAGFSASVLLTFGAWGLFGAGAALCTVGCWKHPWLLDPPDARSTPHSCEESSSDIARCFRGGGQNRPQLRTTDLFCKQESYPLGDEYDIIKEHCSKYSE